jgi:hypothetical protein
MLTFRRLDIRQEDKMVRKPGMKKIRFQQALCSVLDQRFPAVGSQSKALQVNADGSVDVYFGPKAPAGKKGTWVQTIPGKAWFTILRLYGPLEPWFNKTWRPDDIRRVK